MGTGRWIRGGLVVLGMLHLGGCGKYEFLPGTGGTAPQPTVPTRQTLLSTASLDGMVFDTGAAVSAGGRPLVGDLDTTLQGSHARQLFSFDLGALAGSMNVVGARLELHQANVRGTPFATLGHVLLEVVDYGASLEAADFGLAPLPGGALVVSTDPALGVREVDVLTSFKEARLQGRARYQVRLRFSALGSDSDSITDAVEFGDAEMSTPGSLAPRLVVEYLPL